MKHLQPRQYEIANVVNIRLKVYARVINRLSNTMWTNVIIGETFHRLPQIKPSMYNAIRDEK